MVDTRWTHRARSRAKLRGPFHLSLLLSACRPSAPQEDAAPSSPVVAKNDLGAAEEVPEVAALSPTAAPLPEPSLAEEAPVEETPLEEQASIPETPQDVERLTQLGGKAPYIVVHDTAGLLDAMGSHRTIVLEPGVYQLPADSSEISAAPAIFSDGDFHHLEDLTIVGLGTPPPRIIKPDPTDWVFSFADVERLTLYNLTIGHATSLRACAVGVLLFRWSNDVRLAHVDLFGSGAYGFEAVGVRGLTVHHSTIRECTMGLADVVGSSGVELEDVALVDNQYSGTGFTVVRSEVSLRNGTLRRNRPSYAAAMGPLFAIDEPHRVRWLEESLSSEERTTKAPARSRVVLDGVMLTDNVFDALTDHPAQLELRNPPAGSATEADFAAAPPRQHWCLCRRRGREGSSRSETVCYEDDLAACDDAASGKGTDADVLAQSTAVRCTSVLADQPGDWLGGAGWVRDTPAGPWRHAGECLLYSAHTSASSADHQGRATTRVPPPPSSSVPWSSLEPIRSAHARDDGVWVSFETGRRGLSEELAYLEAPLAPSDRRVPSVIEDAKSLYLVTEHGVESIGELKEVRTSSSPLRDWWLGVYAATSARGTGIVTVGKPHSAAKLQLAPKAMSTQWGSDPRVEMLLATGKPTDEEMVRAALDQAQISVQHLAGRFVGGATSIVAMTISLEPGEFFGGLFTLDEHGQVVQVLFELSWSTGVTVDGLVDLDGDGLDEVLVTSWGIEDSDQSLLHLGEDGTKDYYISGGGH